MKRHFNIFLCISMLFSLIGCQSNGYTPKTELEKAFYKLMDNNFTIDYYDCFVNNNSVERNEKFYYTEYSLQAEGDLGFSGIAQGHADVFKYTIDDNQIVSSAPLINSTTGTRFESIYDYTYGMQDFDLSFLPKEKDAEGYYIYKFGENKKNDSLILPIFLREGPTSIPPLELKIKLVADVIYFEAEILYYDFLDASDTVKAIVYDIGKTENKLIKKYLDDGKTSKDPLDMRFYKLFHPYMTTQNYTVDLDATGMNYDFKMTEYCTEDAILDVQGNSSSGYLLYQGVVNSFNVKNDKVNVLSTLTDSDGNFMTSLYGGTLSYTFNDLYYDNLIGYKDNVFSNVYYLTDSYLIYILGYLCYMEIYEQNYCDKVKIEIVNDEKYEFIASFEMYNKQTNQDLGTYRARFYNLNNTVIEPVSNFLSLGDAPSLQTKDNLKNVLDLFKSHNYSCDVLTSAGLAKFYNTPNYFYEELYGNPDNNFGFIKIGDSVLEFSVVNGKVELGQTTEIDANSFPGHGEFFGDLEDAGFISTINDKLYDINNYDPTVFYGNEYWKISDLELSYDIYNYLLASPDEDSILPMGTGLIVKDAGKDSKLTFFVSYISPDGEDYGYQTYTYYDIGTTSHSVIEAYLSSL